MNSKGVIIGTFVKRNRILSFLEMLRNELRVGSDKTFVYMIDRNNSEYLVTFKAYDKDKYVKSLKNFAVLHVKNGCLFSINALNKLIDSEKGDVEESNNEYLVDWEKYKDKLIILTNGELNVSSLTKIEDKSVFFS